MQTGYNHRVAALAVFCALAAACGTGTAEGPLDGPDAGAGGAEITDGGGAGTECGDGACDTGESCSSCAADCGECADCDTGGGGEAEGVDYTSQIQPIFNTRCSGCHPDDGDLNLESYQGALAGGSSGPGVEPCDCESSTIWQKISPNPPFGARMPRGGPYLNESEQQLICDWINQGAGETYDPAACGAAEPPPDDEECTGECGDGTCGGGEDCETCPGDCGECEEPDDPEDTTPPEFAGLDSVEELSGSTCEVYFDPASDDVSASSAIVYDVYSGPRDNVDLSEPIATLESSDLGNDDGELVGSVTLSPGQRYDLIVRARDEAGNSDSNTEEDDCDLR